MGDRIRKNHMNLIFEAVGAAMVTRAGMDCISQGFWGICRERISRGMRVRSWLVNSHGQ
jgi:hypothetical protein